MEGTPRKHQNCRFCNTRSFSGGHFQDPLNFLFLASGQYTWWKWGELTKSPKLSILQYSLLFRKPFPRPLAFLGFPASVQGKQPKSRDFVREKPSTAQNPSGRRTKKLRILTTVTGIVALTRKNPFFIAFSNCKALPNGQTD